MHRSSQTQRIFSARLVGYGKEEIVVELLPRATIQGVGMEGWIGKTFPQSGVCHRSGLLRFLNYSPAQRNSKPTPNPPETLQNTATGQGLMTWQ